ncbi:MAG: dodecin domain-containing protein [Anaerolineae bacterium]|jgi:hypothetical protein|nr:dodecin domain-containing protein [Anaerolineae bacterium]
MSYPVYKQVELTGTSANSIEEAVDNALAKASQSIRNLSWFEVVETRGRVEGSQVGLWQVTIKVGFPVED